MGAVVRIEAETEEAVTSADLRHSGERVVRTSFFRVATRKAAPALARANVLGTAVAVPAAATLAEWFLANAKNRGRDAKIMCFADSSALTERHPVLAQADVVLASGPLFRTFARLGASPMVSFEVEATLDALCAAADPEDPIRVYLVGVGAAALAERLDRHEGVRIAGASDRIGSLEDVNEACPDVVVAIGAGAFEWVRENAPLLDVAVAIGAPPRREPTFFGKLMFVARAALAVVLGTRTAGSLPAAR